MLYSSAFLCLQISFPLFCYYASSSSNFFFSPLFRFQSSLFQTTTCPSCSHLYDPPTMFHSYYPIYPIFLTSLLLLSNNMHSSNPRLPPHRQLPSFPHPHIPCTPFSIPSFLSIFILLHPSTLPDVLLLSISPILSSPQPYFSLHAPVLHTAFYLRAQCHVLQPVCVRRGRKKKVLEEE